MSGKLDRAAASEWRDNWPVVLAGAAGVALSTVHVYSTGVMIAPLEREFGWTRAEISSGPTIVAVIGVLMAPVIGMIIDRIGPRRVGMIGAALVCVAIALLSTATSGIWSWWLLWTFLGLVVGSIGHTVWTAGVSSLFSSARGFALALTLCGTGLGAFLVPMATEFALVEFGWRGAYVALGSFWGLLTLPLIFLLFSSAIDRRRTRPASLESGEAGQMPGLSAREAWRSLRFLKLAIAAAAIVFVLSALINNMVPILVSHGLAASRAAVIAGMVGIGSILGRLCGGYMLDRINGNLVAGVSVLFPIVAGILLLGMPGSVPLSFAAVLIVGLAVGVEYDAVAYLTARHFGMRNFGALFGTIAGLLVLMNGVGPLAINLVYDFTKSYDPALWALIPASLLASALFLSLGPYPEFGERSRTGDLPEGAGQPSGQTA